MKFYTFLLLLLISPLYFKAQGLILKDTASGKTADFPLNRQLDFILYSDSVLQVDYLNAGIAVSYSDSSIILATQEEIAFSDFKSVHIFPKDRYKAQLIASPFLAAGLGFMIKGAIMIIGEGLRSKNRISAPLYFVGGGLVAGVASIPFWGRKKKYDLDKNWEFSFQ